MILKIRRLLRTPHSERFLVTEREQDAAVIDVHYLADGKVDATVILIEGGGIAEAEVPQLLTEIDDIMLPHVSTEAGNLSFSVVAGRVLGAFAPSEQHASEGGVR